MKTPLRILLAAASCCLASCAALQNTPVRLAYTTQVAGHDVTAAYSRADGLILAAQNLRTLTQK